jgi:hypothetical protein
LPCPTPPTPPTPPPTPPPALPPVVKRHTFAFSADRAQCIVDPKSGEEFCINLPVGYDINDQDNPMVQELIAAASRTQRRSK